VKRTLLYAAFAASALLLACASCSSSSPPPSTATANNTTDGGGDAEGGAEAPGGDVELLAAFDLPRQASTQTLSATYYDAAASTLYALQDRTARVVSFTPSADFKTWTPGPSLSLTGRPASAWDGEGLGRAGSTWYAVTVETAPLVERFDQAGAYLGAVDVPARFASQAAGNKGLESLSISPSGKYLFFANEAALTSDGPTATKTAGTRIRVLRRELSSGADEERAYLTEPLGAGTGGDMGVTDVTALDDGRLLILERGYQSDYGNTVRIFQVDFASAPDVSTTSALDASTKTLTKKLVVDLSTLPADGISHPGTQPNPILDNYEALALGPTLPDGRRVVFVTSDDNESAEQVARILALALRL
jgi:hypothetical protein